MVFFSHYNFCVNIEVVFLSKKETSFKTSSPHLLKSNRTWNSSPYSIICMRQRGECMEIGTEAVSYFCPCWLGGVGGRVLHMVWVNIPPPVYRRRCKLHAHLLLSAVQDRIILKQRYIGPFLYLMVIRWLVVCIRMVRQPQ